MKFWEWVIIAVATVLGAWALAAIIWRIMNNAPQGLAVE
jgi:hypothetical protein